MREGSHFDGHQTTGYNLHKKISGLEGLGATRIVFPNATGAACKKGMSIQFTAAQAFWAPTESHSSWRLGNGSIPLPNSHERPRGKQRS
ncbi:hypothetical protein ACVWZ4_001184 [Bradyrhizobium sp. USDA 4472]